ncbi:1-aminocyclopropane-1-carboxylate deaminase/D-cysteine desulfhydrase [Flavobacterium amnicola]|uniref:1-aminocyclopropane-1-carboxylate deaminase/D-cysteine desulfhydrase n=1 Tax=Flavobacterium amnicola TaxID=2506422 RepID=A0A4Q1K4I8_9FLAO|nr:pyridoxal-phosphate dependent enzyme [Flavobacterium amnicola]RXR20472.1 1-aminocyclopropane-1-carboxylate deaminase/D-cysteine desulfhydrase [Flavobacterium amnicola]
MITENQKIALPFKNDISLYIKREDAIHSFVSGNKFRKLKYNLADVEVKDYDSLVTFGGAFSNHIAAVAFACKEKNINCVGVIRGEELPSKIHENPTLQFAQKNGMKFEFVTREQYREKDTEAFKHYLQSKYGDCLILPEGGTNALAVKGCEEILQVEEKQFDYICCAVGTGGTIAGLINSVAEHQKVIGFPALKGDFLQDEIRKFAKNKNWELMTHYHFGGYGKVTNEFIGFINQFFKQTKIPLDPIYTGKMVFGVLDLIEKDYFPPHSKILMIHTGGLQGVQGMNQLLEKRKMTKIAFDE